MLLYRATAHYLRSYILVAFEYYIALHLIVISGGGVSIKDRYYTVELNRWCLAIAKIPYT